VVAGSEMSRDNRTNYRSAAEIANRGPEAAALSLPICIRQQKQCYLP
jgi:hypothetical protein